MHLHYRYITFLNIEVVEMIQNSIARNEKTPEYHIGDVITRLREFFDSGIKEGSPNFNELVLSSFLRDGALGGDCVEREMNQLHSNSPLELKKFGPFAPLIVSCAYCCEASRSLKANNRELAWSLIADAQYWCGVSMANKAVPLAIEKTIKESRTGTARVGGNKRAERFQPIKDEAYRLCKEKCPSKGWHSVKQAADTIAEEVDNFSRGLKIPMSSRLNITIADWLRVMPDAENIFLSMKKNK